MAGYVLVVEDDSHLRQMVAAALSLEGVPYRLARDGDEALRIIRERRPALVLLDLALPFLDGLGVCRALRAEGRDDVPVVLMTGAGCRTIKEATDAYPIAAVLRKPFDLDALLAVISRYLAADADDGNAA